ncbi:MAG: hypothetical protein AB7P37_22390 [Ramlibacter sp.]
MYTRRDFRASLLFAALYLGVCILPGAIAGLCFALWSLWRGLNGEILFLVGGVLAMFLGPTLAAVVFGVLCLGAAVVSGLLFLPLSPLFRQIDSYLSRILFLCSGSLIGLAGGMLGVGFLYSGTLRPVSGWTLPISLVYGLATSGLYLYLHRGYVDDEAARA